MFDLNSQVEVRLLFLQFLHIYEEKFVPDYPDRRTRSPESFNVYVLPYHTEAPRQFYSCNVRV